jgi:hypothetical protein
VILFLLAFAVGFFSGLAAWATEQMYSQYAAQYAVQSLPG